MIKFSVIIPTFNRLEAVTENISNLSRQSISKDQFEIIVVENSVSDANYNKLLSSCDSGICLVRLRSPGLSQARNLGAQISNNEILVFLDDDTFPVNSWLNSYCELFEERGDGVDIICGKILPFWGEGGKPDWLSKRYSWLYAELDLGVSARALTRKERIIGCNFSIRKSIFRTLGGFDETLGHTGSSFGGGEEQDLQFRYRKKFKNDIFYQPEACVIHHFPRERLEKDWVYKRLAAIASNYFDFDLKTRGIFFVTIKILYYFFQYALVTDSDRRHEISCYTKAAFSKFFIMLKKD